MTTKEFAASVETAYGNEIPKIEFTYSAKQFESLEEVKAAGEMLSDKEILGAVNAKARASARTAETVKVLDKAGYKKPDTNSPEFARQVLIKTFAKMQNISEADATAIVDSMTAAVAK